jgi:hypothetical protein
MAPLIGLTALETLNVSMNGQLRNLGPLGALKSLRTLDASWVRWLEDITALLQRATPALLP